jgi:hypothetical protein
MDDRLAFGLTLFDDRRPIAVTGLAYCHASKKEDGDGNREKTVIKKDRD